MSNKAYIIGSDELNKIYQKLDELSQRISNRYLDPAQIIYTEEDVLNILKISSSTLKLWRKENRIKYSKISNQIYYTHQNIVDLVEENTVKKKFQSE